jgi:hypothetical protein
MLSDTEIHDLVLRSEALTIDDPDDEEDLRTPPRLD